LAGADTALLIETDRMVNSLNTFAEQLFRWTASPSSGARP
jgi:hypothetical protein